MATLLLHTALLNSFSQSCVIQYYNVFSEKKKKKKKPVITEAYLEPCQWSMMDFFALIVNSFQPLTISPKTALL